MKNLSKKEILKKCESSDIYIWGARMTGLGAKRFFESHSLKIKGFIDSDPAFFGKKVSGLPVYSPELFIEKNTSELVDKKISIVIAVSLKESEIISKYGKSLEGINFYSFQNESSPSYTVDILSSCNLKCASCPHSIEDNAVPKGSMTLSTFKSVFDKILLESTDLTHISLYSWGEPLIHPYLSEIIDYVHEKNVSVALSSNLSIAFAGRLEKIVKSNPEYLKISISGYYPEAYNNTHQGGNINLVKSNLYYLRYLIDRYNATTLVDINYHLYKDNSGKNFKKIKELSDELGFILSSTYALIMPLERVFAYLDGKPDYWTKKLENNLLVTISEGIEAAKKTPLPKGTCPFRENQININADLTVPICCTTFFREGNLVSENYLTDSLDDINNKKKKIDLCTRCMKENLPEYNMGFNKNIWDSYASQKQIID